MELCFFVSVSDFFDPLLPIVVVDELADFGPGKFTNLESGFTL